MDRRQRVLITGGAGFVGSHLCDRLIDEGHSVTCVDNFLTGLRSNVAHLLGHPRFAIVGHDVIEPLPASIDGAAFDRIYHLASAASPPHYQADPEHTMLTNVVGTRNLLRLAERSGARFLLTSTSEIYGEPELHPQPEDYRGSVNCTGPRACYDEGKRSAEALAFDFARAERADVRVARLFNTYGPRMRADDGRVVSNVIMQALRGEPITIFGDGSQTRSFCYIDDTVEALVRLMECDDAAAQPVNIGNPDEWTVSELVSLVQSRTESHSQLIFCPLPEDDPTRRCPDIARARDLLSWSPRVLLADGIEPTIEWFAEQIEEVSEPAKIAAQ